MLVDSHPYHTGVIRGEAWSYTATDKSPRPIGHACYSHLFYGHYGHTWLAGYYQDKTPNELADKFLSDFVRYAVPDFVWQNVQLTFNPKETPKGRLGAWWLEARLNTEVLDSWSAKAFMTLMRYVHEHPGIVEYYFALREKFPNLSKDLCFVYPHLQRLGYNTNHQLISEASYYVSADVLKKYRFRDKWKPLEPQPYSKAATIEGIFNQLSAHSAYNYNSYGTAVVSRVNPIEEVEKIANENR